MDRLLRTWQQEFIEKYGASDAQKSLLIAVAGSGKCITALTAAKNQLINRKVSNIVVVSDRKILQQQWRHVGKDVGLSISESLSSFEDGSAVTFQHLSKAEEFDEFKRVVSKRDSLIIFDEVYRYLNKANEISDAISLVNSNSKFLYLSSTPLPDDKFDWSHSMELGREFLYQPEIIQLPELKIEIAKYSPSLNLLDRLQSKILTIDDLSWRQFEILVSQLLESDGYDIELMKGSKDGGVDIVAVKDMKEAGLFKAVWQAKKYKMTRKIGISTIRELAVVRNEFGASKGMLVTSSFLTRGALERVYRDRFTLGKVDREDLKAWIDRRLFE